MSFITTTVENGINTCYIDSLLTSLFCFPSSTENILSKDVDDTNLIILQGTIMEKFIKPLRTGELIDADTMMFIRECMHQLGWRSDEDLFEQQDVSELYSFFCDVFNGEMIKTKRTTYSESIDEKTDGAEEIIPFISLNLDESQEKTTVINLINKWLYNNECSIKRTIEIDGNEFIDDVKGINTYEIINKPNYLCFGINRFHNDVKIKTAINISTYIKPFKSDNTYYQISSAICHKGISYKNGHYYSFLCDNDNKKYYIFDDLKSPSIEEIDITDNEKTLKIGKEIVFLVYTKIIT